MESFAVEDRDGGGESGFIRYDPDLKSVIVDLKVSPAKRTELESFFLREQEFLIPETDRIDDYRVEKARPVDSLDHFQMALTELYGATGVWVLW